MSNFLCFNKFQNFLFANRKLELYVHVTGIVLVHPIHKFEKKSYQGAVNCTVCRAIDSESDD